MPSQADRRRARTDGKPNTTNRPRNRPSSYSWKFFVTGLLIAVASAGYYYLHKTGSLDSSQVEKTEEDLNVTDGPIFTAVEIEGKGIGLIAARDIKQGELVLEEKPLFIVPRNINSSPTRLIGEQLAKLSLKEQEEFFSLSYVNFPEHLEPDEHPDEVALAIFQTNAVSAGDDVGLFPTMARLNHGCSSAFNVVYSWRTENQYLVVHAMKDIPKGRELLTTYTNTKKPREYRRAFLKDQYGFHCTCDVCSLPDDLSQASDQRLLKISSLYDKFATWGKEEIDGAQAMDYVRSIWRLEEEEGYWSERGSLAADATWIAASHSDATATEAWARKAIEWFKYEIGAESPQVRALMAVADRPASHKAWGTRNNLVVGGPEH